jgi:uncharacterized protein YyaL (SSP411 family)
MQNRLAKEDSFYLKSHASDPFDWYAWGEEAFREAKTHNKPIFLSIGYSSCHWCHVMQKEVFKDAKLAEYMRKHFISIKLDREERPDLDKHFQEIHQYLTGRAGGWPTSIFLTSEQKPFFARTYIPLNTGQYGIGFVELAQNIVQSLEKSDDILQKADEIVKFIAQPKEPTKAVAFNKKMAKLFMDNVEANFDAVYGGFKGAPKFPHASLIDTLLNIHALQKDERALEMASFTLKKMAKGGLRDVVDGGFCRYSVDEAWLVPHFEKMTYDNALLIQSYAKAYLQTNERFYKDIAMQTCDFMLEKMSQEGLFYCASDADSEGEEGKYFVYAYDEVKEALSGFENKEEILAVLSVSKEGNFEGKNIICLRDFEPYAWFDAVKAILQAIRKERLYPFVDKKILTSWNAMMIEALFLSAHIEKKYLHIATASLDALLSNVFKEGKLYHSFLIGKEAKIEGFLEDYAYLISALLEGYKATLNEEYLRIVTLLANEALANFYRNGKWIFSNQDMVVEAEFTDMSYPASAAVICNALITLGYLVDSKYLTFAYKSIEYYSANINRYVVSASYFVGVVLRYLYKDLVIKAKDSMLRDIKPYGFGYPFMLLKSEEEERFNVCSESSCFASSESLEALEREIKRVKEELCK